MEWGRCRSAASCASSIRSAAHGSKKKIILWIYTDSRLLLWQVRFAQNLHTENGVASPAFLVPFQQDPRVGGHGDDARMPRRSAGNILIPCVDMWDSAAMASHDASFIYTCVSGHTRRYPLGGTMAIWPYYNHTTHMAKMVKMVKMVLKHKHGPYLRVSHLF